VAGDRVGIAGTVDAIVLVREVVAPVLFEVAVADDSAYLKDGFGAVQTPAGACDVHLYQQSLDIRQELGDRDGVAKSLHQLGRLHQRQGEHEQARQLYQR
jgi:tetratricopeptide repeat protein